MKIYFIARIACIIKTNLIHGNLTLSFFYEFVITFVGTKSVTKHNFSITQLITVTNKTQLLAFKRGECSEVFPVKLAVRKLPTADIQWNTEGACSPELCK
jgi:hypothetical protein